MLINLLRFNHVIIKLQFDTDQMFGFHSEIHLTNATRKISD